MPELPEVETVARDLRRHGIEGRVVRRVRVYWPRTVAGLSPAAFSRRLTGRRIVRIGRRAKYLVFNLAHGSVLLVHLRMTGRFVLAPADVLRDPHERLALELDDGRTVRFLDSRKFGRWTLTAAPGTILDKLGPEPLESGFRAPEFAAELKRRRRQIKPLLLDQTFVAGIGNIYADEALWEAGLHPRRLASGLSGKEAHRLHAAIRLVLRRGVANAGTSLGAGRANFYSVAGRRGRNQDGLKVFRRAGAPCPRCGAIIGRIVVGQRGTHLCPACQRMGGRHM
jgi:formamidopyrimidine-DNA glycosylase